MNGERGEESTMNAIIDLMDLELGVSSNKQDVSARSKFNAFLKVVSPDLSFTSLTEQNITMELIGQFCSFMLNDSTIHWQTSMNYLSSIKRQLEDKLKVTIFKSDQDWYRRCRRNLHHQYVLQAIKTGKRLKDQAAMMTLEDLETICKVLFAQNEVRALMDRTLLTSQWLSIGRSSDIGNLLFDDLHWLGDFLVIDLTRLKVRQQHSISLFCSPGNWAIDPYHSLACQLIADPWNASDRVFSQIVDGKNEARIAAHINRVLKSLYNDDSAARLTPGLQSHSARRGGAAFASSNSEVKLCDLAHRGLWSMDGFATLLEYISPTSASDQKVAKVLSGWTDPEKSGKPPSLDVFANSSHEAHVRVESFALEMRRKYFSKLQTRSFTDCMTATVLMYLDETLMLAPDHVIHVNITSAAKAMRLRVPSTSELKDWGRVIRKQFVLDNILSLPIRFIKSNMSERELSEQYLGIHTFAGALERGVLGYREVMNELQNIKQLLHRVLDRQYEQQHHDLACPLPNLEVASLASSANMVQTVVHRVGPLGTMTRSWPSDFDSVKGIKLQDLIVRYVRDGLAYARYSPRNRVHKEVQSAMQVVGEFVDLSTLPVEKAATSETSDVRSSQALTKFARMVQTRILSFIEDNRSDSGKRRRALTGSVSGIVRAWGALSKGKRDVTFTLNKLVFKG